jgi:hypothetical protein
MRFLEMRGLGDIDDVLRGDLDVIFADRGLIGEAFGHILGFSFADEFARIVLTSAIRAVTGIDGFVYPMGIITDSTRSDAAPAVEALLRLNDLTEGKPYGEMDASEREQALEALNTVRASGLIPYGVFEYVRDTLR